ncbi:hypothetical protein ABK040_004572 [Willaertia magna]
MYSHNKQKKNSYLLLITFLLALILLQFRSVEVKAMSLRNSVRLVPRNNQLFTTVDVTISNITQISQASYSSVQLQSNQFAIFYIDIPADKVVSFNYYCLSSKDALNLYTNFNSIPTLSNRGNFLGTVTQDPQTRIIKRKSSNSSDNSVVRLYLFVLNTSPVLSERFYVTAKLFDDIPDNSDNNNGFVTAISILIPALIIIGLALVIFYNTLICSTKK